MHPHYDFPEIPPPPSPEKKISTMFNECFPLISVRTSSRDPPFVSPLVKHLLKFRNNLQKRPKPFPVGLEDRINHLIREN